jgi:hypothetical protein
VTDAEYEKHRDRLKSAIERWVTPCGLRTWERVDFVYCRTAEEFAADSGVELSEGNRDVAGSTKVLWRYKTAYVYLNVPVIAGLNDERVDYVVRHEIAHILVNEMREWAHADHGSVALDHEERCVTELAMVLGWVRCADDEEREKKSKELEARASELSRLNEMLLNSLRSSVRRISSISAVPEDAQSVRGLNAVISVAEEALGNTPKAGAETGRDKA